MSNHKRRKPHKSAARWLWTSWQRIGEKLDRRKEDRRVIEEGKREIDG